MLIFSVFISFLLMAPPEGGPLHQGGEHASSCRMPREEVVGYERRNKPGSAIGFNEFEQ
jgi:hypothetical protein